MVKYLLADIDKLLQRDDFSESKNITGATIFKYLVWIIYIYVGIENIPSMKGEFC